MQQQRLILIKTTPYSETGHLYEHLYVTALNRYFLTRSLYTYLDYHVEAFTSGKGIIYFTITLYSDQAIACVDNVSRLKIDMTLIDTHVRQLALENGSTMDVADASKVHAELQRLDDEPWINIHDLEHINMQDKELPSDVLHVSDTTYRRSKMYVNVTFEGGNLLADKPELLVLFRQLSLLLLHNYTAALCNQTEAYSVQDDFYDYGDSASTINTYYVSAPSWDLPASVDIMQRVTQQIMHPSVLDKFALQMQANFSGQGSFSDPDDMQIYQETGLLIGTKGWQNLATSQNIASILARSSVEVKVGRKRTKISL